MLPNTGAAMRENLNQISYALEDLRSAQGGLKEHSVLGDLFKSLAGILEGQGYGHAAFLATDLGRHYDLLSRPEPICLGCDEEVRYCECESDEDEE